MSTMLSSAPGLRMLVPEGIAGRSATGSRIVTRHYRGEALADVEKIRCVAGRVAAAAQRGTRVIVVVEAMGDTNAPLLKLAQASSAAPDRRELDMLLSPEFARLRESGGIGLVTYAGLIAKRGRSTMRQPS